MKKAQQDSFNFESAPREQGLKEEKAGVKLEAVFTVSPRKLEERISHNQKAQSAYSKLEVIEHNGKTSVTGNKEAVTEFLSVVIVSLCSRWLLMVKRVN